MFEFKYEKLSMDQKFTKNVLLCITFSPKPHLLKSLRKGYSVELLNSIVGHLFSARTDKLER